GAPRPPPRRHRRGVGPRHRGRQGAPAALRRRRHQRARRRIAQELHGPQDQRRGGSGTHLPAPRTLDRRDQGDQALQGPAREALLPPQEAGQERAPHRAAKPGRDRHEVTSRAWRRLARAEARLTGAGATVAGVDEAGRGPLAGPVVAAAVILEPGGRWDGLNDSKQMSAETRDELYARVLNEARAFAWSVVGPRAID